jgi:uncharacterized protein YndB with AHSA1/START domain
MQRTGVDPIVRSVVVKRSQEDAFRLFTEGIGEWWPLGSHSVFGDRAQIAIFETKEGGRIFERTADGEEAEWGRVLVWEPASRVLYDWSPEPGQTVPTEVEVRFIPEGDLTRVELEHRGWERLGDGGEEKRASYNAHDGWTQVIGSYVEVAGE